MMDSDYWDAEAAAGYEASSAFMFAPEVLDPAVDFLAGLAGEGPVLELALGTGRVAIPLAERGIPITGIELSQPMTDALHARSPGLEVTVGDMATATAPGPPPGSYSLVFVVWNSLGNVRTQDAQVATFANAARHLQPGGRLVVEMWIPAIRRWAPGSAAVPFHVGRRHVGFDTYDLATQQGTSHHYTTQDDGTFRYTESNFRYCWPAELDLMARLSGLEHQARYADWRKTAITSDSESAVSVWRKPR